DAESGRFRSDAVGGWVHGREGVLALFGGQRCPGKRGVLVNQGDLDERDGGSVWIRNAPPEGTLKRLRAQDRRAGQEKTQLSHRSSVLFLKFDFSIGNWRTARHWEGRQGRARSQGRRTGP